MQENYSAQGFRQPFEFQKEWEDVETQNDENVDAGYQGRHLRTTSESKRNYSYQTQKIIINDLEENESPTYKDFFEKDRKVISTQNDTEEEEEEGEGDELRSSKPRWELLYGKAKELKKAREGLRKEHEAQQHDPECTFKPKLMASYNKNLMTVECMDNENVLPLYERNKIWKSRVDNRILESRDLLKDRDLHGCTFKPDIVKSQAKEVSTRGLTSYGSKGVDLFLRRHIIAKQSRGEKDKILENPLQKLPAHVYKKDGNITIPKAPEFNKGKPVEINSLKKPLEFPTPTKSSTFDDISPRKTMSAQKASQVLVDPIQVNNVKFGEAIQMLHHELHRMNFN